MNPFTIINSIVQSIFGLLSQPKPPEIIPPYQVQPPVLQSTTNEKIKIWFTVNGIYLIIGFFLHLQYL